MRPVNLIPEEQRRGPSAKRRGGPLAYVLVGAMVALLAGVTMLVLTNNQISQDKTEIATLEAETTAAESKAASLAAYTQLRDVSESRVPTVTELADSRFNWERVLREIALVLPSEIWLTNLTGTVKPSVVVENGATIAIRASVPGPALQILGCAPGQDGVARFISALKDVDGVTRVGVQESAIGTEESGSGAESDSAGTATTECPKNGYTSAFQIVVAFDAAPTPTTEGVE